MDEFTTLLDPTSELQPPVRAKQVRPGSLEGRTVGILDISKARGDVFLDRLDERLSADGISVNRYRKPTFARVAPVALRQEISAEVDVMIEGLAD